MLHCHTPHCHAGKVGGVVQGMHAVAVTMQGMHACMHAVVTIHAKAQAAKLEQR